MMTMRSIWRTAALAVAVAAAPAGWAADKAKPAAGQGEQRTKSELESRVQRLERLLDSRTLLQMSERLDALQKEVQGLRGRVEELQHTVEGVRERQRDLYLDVDRRLSRMERQQSAGGGKPAAAGGTGEEGGGKGEAPAKDEAAAEAGSKAPMEGESQAYQKAFGMLRELRYARAVEAFKGFLKDYPDGRYAPMAQYWLGEAHYAQGKYEQAIVHYWRLINNYADSPKLAEAMLKIGYSRNELGKKAEARKILKELVRRFPDSTEAGQAETLLQKLGEKG